MFYTVYKKLAFRVCPKANNINWLRESTLNVFGNSETKSGGHLRLMSFLRFVRKSPFLGISWKKLWA